MTRLRSLAFVVAASSGAIGLLLALHHPVAPVLATGSFIASTLIAMAWPSAWLFFVPALLPIAGFASWTGWIAYEEFDLLMLAASAGGYLRIAFSSRTESSAKQDKFVMPAVWIVLVA